MPFDDLPEEPRQRGIRLLEDSLFGAVTRGAQYFHDIPPTLPGFTNPLQIGVPHYRVTIDTRLLKV